MPIMPDRRLRLAAAVIALAVLPMALPFPAFAARTVEKAIAPQKSPPGDIPDNQVFIDYVAPGGAHLRVPEGWARADFSNGAHFNDKFDGLALRLDNAAKAPSLESVKGGVVAKLKASGRAIKVSDVSIVNLPAGQAVRISYSSNSEPSRVTTKQIRLENQRFLFFKNGTLATLSLYAPFGADNVDQWRLISKSFRWH